MNTKLLSIVMVAFLLVVGCSSTKTTDTGKSMPVPADNTVIQETVVSDTQPNDEVVSVPVEGQEDIQDQASGSNLPTEPSVKELRITAYNFGFTVEPVTINKGDTVKVIMTSTEGTHGFALPDFGVSIKPVSPGEEKTAEFVADKSGDFAYFCNVPCGAGHQSMKGNIVVS